MAGGGTGGHVFPMIAVAEALGRLDPTLRLVFVGTERGLETKVVPERGYELELMQVLPIRGGGLKGAMRGVLRAAQLVPEGRRLVKRLNPQAVFSIGGYAAGPVCVAARTLGIPVALMEPNSVIGLANWLIARLVQRAYTAFPESEKHFPRGKVLRSGVPIRTGFEPQPYELGDELRLLVLGGSQGAKALNEALPQALKNSGARLRIIHQAGKGRDEDVRQRYAAVGLADRVSVPAFIEDMPQAIANADLVVSRSGASAVSELCAIGRPSLLIPYPYAAGDHQRFNALSVENDGAAVCVAQSEASVERLTEELTALLGDRTRLERMARAATTRGEPQAADTIARDLLTLAGLEITGLDDQTDGAAAPSTGNGGGTSARAPQSTPSALTAAPGA